MSRRSDKIALGLFLLLPAAIILSAMVAVAGLNYATYLAWESCYELEVLGSDEQKSEYMMTWATKLANDPEIADGLRERSVSDRGRVSRGPHYSHAALEGFDHFGLGFRSARSLLFVDSDLDGKTDLIRFPSGRNSLTIVVNKDHKAKDFVAEPLSPYVNIVNDQFMVYCDNPASWYGKHSKLGWDTMMRLFQF